jgi:hypothetical protein
MCFLRRARGPSLVFPADNGELATVLGDLTWERVYHMEGVSAYLPQNIAKLKLNRLRIWAGQEEGFICQAETCALGNAGGVAHLVWQCPEAHRFWKAYGEGWGYAKDETMQAAEGLISSHSSSRRCPHGW